MNNSCFTFQNSLSELQNQLQKLTRLVDNFVTAPNTEEQKKIQENISQLYENFEKFQKEYTNKTLDLLWRWRFGPHSYRLASKTNSGELFEIEANGMVAIKSPSPRVSYWPELIRQVKGSLTAPDLIDSLKNTEVIEGTLTVNDMEKFSAPCLLSILKLDIQYVSEVDFPKVEIIAQGLILANMKNAYFPKLTSVPRIQIESVTNPVFSLLKKIPSSLTFTDRTNDRKNNFRKAFPLLNKVGKGSIGVSGFATQEILSQMENDPHLKIEGIFALTS